MWLAEVDSLGFRVWGFRVLGFRVFGFKFMVFRALGFRALGFRASSCAVAGNPMLGWRRLTPGFVGGGLLRVKRPSFVCVIELDETGSLRKSARCDGTTSNHPNHFMLIRV